MINRRWLFYAKYDCSKHGGPTDGYAFYIGNIFRDNYAEQHNAK
jgi:hypothetical protein